MHQIDTLQDFIHVLTYALGNTEDNTVLVHQTTQKYQVYQSTHVVLALDLRYPSSIYGFLLNKKVLLDSIDAFLSVELGFDVTHGISLEFSKRVIGKLQRREVEPRIAKLRALIGARHRKPKRNVAPVQWAINALALGNNPGAVIPPQPAQSCTPQKSTLMVSALP